MYKRTHTHTHIHLNVNIENSNRFLTCTESNARDLFSSGRDKIRYELVGIIKSRVKYWRFYNKIAYNYMYVGRQSCYSMLYVL